MASIEIKAAGDKVQARTPYHPEFIKLARNLNGRWVAAAGAWSFDARDLDRVKEGCRKVYGTAGEPVPTCTVRINVVPFQYEPALYLCGREVAKRAARDHSVKLGDGVVILSGGFPSSGGSVKNPTLSPREGTVIEVRDVPLSVAEAEVGAWEGDPIAIVADSIVTPGTAAGERDRAVAEIRRLMEVHAIGLEELR